MTSSNQTDPATTRGAAHEGTGASYLLLLLILALGAYAVWQVLGACGIQFAGRTIVLSWCAEPPAIVRSLAALEDRNRFLKDQIHDAELDLMSPDACGPAVEVAQEQEEARLCEPNEVLQQPQVVALVLDGSGSMDYSVNAPAELEQRALVLWEQISFMNSSPFGGSTQKRVLEGELNAVIQELESTPGRRRMDAAQDSLQQVVAGAPSAITLSFTSFTDCDQISSQSYSMDDRDSLQNAIRAVNTDGGTPIARAIQRAANSLEEGADADDPVNMVLITDGNDSCGGDPCAVAQDLKAQRPGLIINVVYMSQSDVLQCISEVTGGFYQRYRGSDPSQLIQAIMEAAGYSGAGQCRAAGAGDE